VGEGTRRAGLAPVSSFGLGSNEHAVSNQPLDVKAIKVGNATGIDTVVENGAIKAIDIHLEAFPQGAGALLKRNLDTKPTVERYLRTISAVSPTEKGVIVTVALTQNRGQFTMASSAPATCVNPGPM
jgi:hypothetical protein